MFKDRFHATNNHILIFFLLTFPARKELMYYKIISKFPNLQRMLQSTFDIDDIIQAFN